MTGPLQASGLGVKWFEAAIRLIISWLRQPFERGLGDLAEQFFFTPLPATGTGVERVFGAPAASDEPWHSIYNSVVGGEVMVLALLLLYICVQGRHTVRIFNVGSGYQARRTHRSAWTGAILIVGWYWLAVLTLYFVEGLTVVLLPDLAGISRMLLSILPTALSNPLLSLVMSLVGAIAMLGLEALFFIRHVLLYGYLYLMPVGLAIAFSNLPVVARIARGLCQKFIPLAVLPIPAALLFRTYELLLGNSYVSATTPFLRFLLVVSLPVLSLYVSWKTFRYASPLTARLIRGTTGVAITAGAVAGVGSPAGPRVASTAMRSGAKVAAGEAAVRRFAGPTINTRTETTASKQPSTNTGDEVRQRPVGSPNRTKDRSYWSGSQQRSPTADSYDQTRTDAPVPQRTGAQQKAKFTPEADTDGSSEDRSPSAAETESDGSVDASTDREHGGAVQESTTPSDGDVSIGETDDLRSTASERTADGTALDDSVNDAPDQRRSGSPSDRERESNTEEET